jgi:hypothetical protein
MDSGLKLVSGKQSRKLAGMKSVTMRVEKEQLDRLLAEVRPGDAVILTDGAREIMFESAPPLDLDEDSPDLAKELLKAIDGPFADYSRGELEAIAARVLAEKKRE